MLISKFWLSVKLSNSFPISYASLEEEKKCIQRKIWGWDLSQRNNATIPQTPPRKDVVNLSNPLFP